MSASMSSVIVGSNNFVDSEILNAPLMSVPIATLKASCEISISFSAFRSDTLAPETSACAFVTSMNALFPTS